MPVKFYQTCYKYYNIITIYVNSKKYSHNELNDSQNILSSNRHYDKHILESNQNKIPEKKFRKN